MKTQNIDPKEDLLAIRNMMERSSKFLSLSGLSGVFAGICALIGATIAYFLILDSGQLFNDENLHALGSYSGNSHWIYLGVDALAVLIISTIGALYFSVRKASKVKLPFWTNSTRRLFAHLLIPFFTGGILAAVLVFRNDVELVAPVTLIFYGLALINAGKFTFGEIHYLGLTEIVLGILAAIFISHSLLFWALGFGVMHIVYGVAMYYKYER